LKYWQETFLQIDKIRKIGMYPTPRTSDNQKEKGLIEKIGATDSWPSSHGTVADLLHGQTKVLLGRDHTDSVGVAHTATPSLNTDDGVALVDDAELETVVDTPLEAAVNILLPDLDVEVRLVLGEVEGPDTTVQVGVLEELSLAWNRLAILELQNLPGKRWRCE
jgi:hypothetical protein